MFKFSTAGVKNIDIYSKIYADFISWCKSLVSSGTFSTYCDGEPVCFSEGREITYRMYKNSTEN